MMEITDLQGKVITITDIDGSIALAAEFMGYHHIDADESLKRFDRQREAYWKDFYKKLLQLKEQQNNEQNEK